MSDSLHLSPFDADRDEVVVHTVNKTFTCDTCGTKGSLRWMGNHPCETVATLASFGGRCEDYPCCGHVGADAGCAPQESHTSEYWLERMRQADDEGYDLEDLDD